MWLCAYNVAMLCVMYVKAMVSLTLITNFLQVLMLLRCWLNDCKNLISYLK